MRISIDKESPYYQDRLYDFLVFLDGKRLRLCTMADEDEGVAEVIKTEKDNQTVVTKDDEVVTETLHGDVVITTQKSGKILSEYLKENQ